MAHDSAPPWIEPDELTVAEAAAIWQVERTTAWRIVKAYQAVHRFINPKLIVLPRAEVARIATLARRGRGKRGPDKQKRRAP